MDLYDIYQNKRIAQSEQNNKRTARSVEENQELVLELKKSVKKLYFLCNAMWQILQETTELSDQDLMDRVEQLKQEDTANPTCPKCGRANANRRAAKCLYCGTIFPKETIASRLFQI